VPFDDRFSHKRAGAAPAFQQPFGFKRLQGLAQRHPIHA
jgi:hypothetical protein